MTTTYEVIATLIRACQACPLAFRGAGVAGEYVDGCMREPHLCKCPPTEIMIIGEAPGRVEQEEGRPFVGESGQLLRALLEECGVSAAYLTNVVKHRPPVTIGYKGKQEKPNAEAIKACAGFLDAEIELIRPTKLVLLGNVAASRLLKVASNTAQKELVNRVWKVDLGYGEVEALTLFHPAYFLHSRTAPWVNRALSEWKRSLRNFLGAPIPNYPIEKVICATSHESAQRG